jgi:hypothetical protein
MIAITRRRADPVDRDQTTADRAEVALLTAHYELQGNIQHCITSSA